VDYTASYLRKWLYVLQVFLGLVLQNLKEFTTVLD
jgi:hypothetical protein